MVKNSVNDVWGQCPQGERCLGDGGRILGRARPSRAEPSKPSASVHRAGPLCLYNHGEA